MRLSDTMVHLLWPLEMGPFCFYSETDSRFIEMVSADDSVVACFYIRQNKTHKYVCFRLHEFLK